MPPPHQRSAPEVPAKRVVMNAGPLGAPSSMNAGPLRSPTDSAVLNAPTAPVSPPTRHQSQLQHAAMSSSQAAFGMNAGPLGAPSSMNTGPLWSPTQQFAEAASPLPTRIETTRNQGPLANHHLSNMSEVPTSLSLMPSTALASNAPSPFTLPAHPQPPAQHLTVPKPQGLPLSQLSADSSQGSSLVAPAQPSTDVEGKYSALQRTTQQQLAAIRADSRVNSQAVPPVGSDSSSTRNSVQPSPLVPQAAASSHAIKPAVATNASQQQIVPSGSLSMLSSPKPASSMAPSSRKPSAKPSRVNSDKAIPAQAQESKREASQPPQVPTIEAANSINSKLIQDLPTIWQDLTKHFGATRNLIASLESHGNICIQMLTDKLKPLREVVNPVDLTSWLLEYVNSNATSLPKGIRNLSADPLTAGFTRHLAAYSQF